MVGPGAGRGMAAASLTGCKTAKERRKTPKNSHQTSQILTGGSGVAKPRERSRGTIHPKIHVVGNEGVGPWGAARSLTGGTIQGPLDEAARAGWVHPRPGGSDRESWSSATSTMAEATPGMGRRQLEGENCSLEGLHPSLCPQMGSGKGPQSQARPPGTTGLCLHLCREGKSTLSPHLDTEKREPPPSPFPPSSPRWIQPLP